MEKNVGYADRIARLVIGIVLLIGGIYGYTANMNMVLVAVVLLIGAILVVTGATQSCLLYTLLGMSTKESE